MDCIITCVAIPTTAFIYSVPLCFCSVKSNARKPCAITEDSIANTRHAVGDNYARESCASLKGIMADACHTVGDCHTRKPGATREGFSAYARHVVGDC